ncbi:unnamed protein product [Cunninghamella echinulata]
MSQQEVYGSDQTEKYKVEQTSVNYIEEDRASSIVNEFGHGKGSFLTAYFNIVCVVAGTGTLGLPHAFAQGGWLGILILLLAYGMSVYSGVILIRCLYYKPGHRLHDFKEIGSHAFGMVGYIISSCLHLLNLFGCPALYLVLAADNMVLLLKGTSGELNHRIWTIIWGVFLLIPSLVMKTLREVTYIAAIGAVCTMMAVFIILIESPIEYNKDPSSVVRDGVIWTGFPSSLATIAFSFGGNNTYPHVEHALKKPHQWRWAVLAGLSTCTGLYILTAIPAYYSFGQKAVSPIYKALPDGDIGRTIAIIVMTIHVILAIPIYTTSFSLEFEKFSRANEERLGKFGAWLARAVIRTCTMAILVVLAMFVPFFDDFMGLIGALANCGLVFLIPVTCYLKLTGVRNKPIYELAFCALTIFLAIVGMVFGSKDAILNLIRDFNNEK